MGQKPSPPLCFAWGLGELGQINPMVPRNQNYVARILRPQPLYYGIDQITRPN